METEELAAALTALGWKGADFARKAGISRNTMSRWVTGKTPIPDWVPSYLRAMQAIKDLYEATVAPGGGDDAGQGEQSDE